MKMQMKAKAGLLSLMLCLSYGMTSFAAPLPQTGGGTHIPQNDPISVYPNPATTEVTVSSSNELIYRIIMRDASGRELLNISTNGVSSEKIALDGFAPGTVTVAVYTNALIPTTLTLTIL